MSHSRHSTAASGEFHPSSLTPGTAARQSLSGPSSAPPATVAFRVIEDTPPGSPNQGLLDETQYATYNPEKDDWSENNGPEVPHVVGERFINGWTPISLKKKFWIPLVIFQIVLAAVLERMLAVAQHINGWPIPTSYTDDIDSPFHYVYTLPPVIIAMVLVALWAWSDIEIKKMQPYLDLLHGDSPPNKSLLLDYTRTNNFVVWISAALNQHYLVALATIIGLLALVFQPVASAIFSTKPTYITTNLSNMSNLGAISLNLGQEFTDLTSFLSAAGYASSSVLYNLGDPNFLHGPYTIAPFERLTGLSQLPRSLMDNGTVKANTTAVKTSVNCALTTTTSVPYNGNGWTNHATYDNCTFTYSVNQTTAHLFGTNVMPDCNNTGRPDWFLPIVLWFFTYDSSPPQGSATYCAPSISLWNVEATVDIGTGNLTNVVELSPLNTSTFAGSSASDVMALNGMAYNGVAFNLTGADEFVTARAAATKVQLPASILEYASLQPGGVAAAFADNSTFTNLSVQVYTTYMKLVAKSTYFQTLSGQSIPVQVSYFQSRLWLNAVAVHVGASVLAVVAVLGAFIQLAHAHSRRYLRLHHQPGTIASAVTIGAQTSLAKILHGQQEEKEIVQALQDKRFRIHPQTMKILTMGERGYEEAVTPNRPGFFQSLKSPGLSKRFSRGVPASA
ncbi:hypothetical protein HWV62_17000 [Athelia sp. TMB]|nr:hypothetical protein HWV62_17000 [Athelia sp. TMB]